MWSPDLGAQSASANSRCIAARGAENIPPLFARWIEDVWHQGRVELVPQIIGAQYVRHEGNKSRTVTPAEYADEITATRRLIPDVRFLIHDCAAVGDRLWTRWTMLGTSKESGLAVRRMAAQIYRIANGRLVETWAVMLPSDGTWPEARVISPP